MNRNTTIGIVVLAACGLVVWAIQSGSIRRPGPGAAGDVSVTVRPFPDVQERGATPKENPGANGYGSISGQIVFEGEIPECCVLIRVGDDKVEAEDRAICARQEILDESLIIDEKTRGIANVFVYLSEATRAIHLQRNASEEKRVLCDIMACRYVPHVLFARTDQVVVVRINDDCVHNVHENPKRNRTFGGTIKPLDETREIKFPHRRSERQPFAVACDLHPWMKAWWLILDHPFAAITDAHGDFKIADLPAGTYEFRVWHEVAGDIRRDWKVTVKAGETADLGELRVPAEKFAGATRRVP